MELILTPDQDAGIRLKASQAGLSPEAFLVQSFAVQLKAFGQAIQDVQQQDLIASFMVADDATKKAATELLKTKK